MKRLLMGFAVLISVVALTASAQEDPAARTAAALFGAEVPPRDRVLLAQQVQGIEVATQGVPDAPDWQLGDARSFYVHSGTEGTVSVQAEVAALGQHSVFFVDVRANVTREQAQRLADAFDSRIYGKVRALWGSEPMPGIDGDPRVYVLLANDVSPSVLAYFSSTNLMPAEIAPTSSEADVLVVNASVVASVLSSPESLESTLAHEFQHMIRANVNPNVGTWLNEGLSVFTEFYLGYSDPFNAAYRYLSQPETSLTDWNQTTADYGAAALFVAYFFERYGPAGLEALSASDAYGMAAVADALARINGGEADVLFADWLVANWVNDSVTDTRWGYRRLFTLDAQPRALDRSAGFPATLGVSAAAYSAHYMTLPSVTTDTPVNVVVNAPSTIPLTRAPGGTGSRAMYSNRADDSMTLLTREIDLTGASQASLTYSLWYDLELEWDYGYVLVSTDGGDTWEPQTTPLMTAENPHGTAIATGYTGSTRDWVSETISLDAYAGMPILVRYMVVTDDAATEAGLLLDDVRLTIDGTVTELWDFEDDDGGWISEGWFLSDNLVPLSTWVQVVQTLPDGAVQLDRFLSAGADNLPVTLKAGAQTVVIVAPAAPLTSESVLLQVSVDLVE